MKPFLTCAAAASLGLGGCMAPAPAEDLPAMLEGTCNAEPLQSHIGHKASAASGAELLRLAGARTLRWVPPRSAVTMDYRADRLTVSYDDDYTIVRISCG
ncbi:MAG: hypothetical protein B7Y36_17675 [Novosphingobium sp. 28-62-57]|uniref:I78 family peptidase inhibitor n=1 Tax=unclassified Novosphingobium TaxID=2644732 RepID=UPI000BC4BB3E|nr:MULTISPECIES: I78 family peptidase inhibitor [unclassified Novosphingobium]OYW48706.1 MAG: hypothetical protein B7Z34_12450 [Novosphingobium sp. 12-62-10]OYZ35486.1 MAG: hypothetical protein B7Y31_11090 [Novosphingobium sp. 16-62-11]OZA35868.1 MAG: hypothetical protein B7X92_08725 [Novosphingobium sp. 17-62-9]OYZ08309.1 MAG: hypothetical protein B7Y36_17675 [Novosphingobium sp. 28-62-57]HQS69393.1 I78 family peptidase inhibitor [Novosphingobium sp.]